jgi:hypothetical protein
LNDNTLQVDRILADITLRTGYTKYRWKWSIVVIIPKNSDTIRVDKLRTIVRMDGGFNHLNKIIGKHAMSNAEKCGTIAQEQYNSRKQKKHHPKCYQQTVNI